MNYDSHFNSCFHGFLTNYPFLFPSLLLTTHVFLAFPLCIPFALTLLHISSNFYYSLGGTREYFIHTFLVRGNKKKEGGKITGLPKQTECVHACTGAVGKKLTFTKKGGQSIYGGLIQVGT